MRIFLDEDLASGLLAKLLQNAGHDVVEAAGVPVDNEYIVLNHWR